MYTFSTRIGTCGIDWNERGISRVDMCTKKRGSTTKPPAWVSQAAKRIANHLAGKNDDLKDIKVDLSNFTSFTKRIYTALRDVKPGRTVTYGELAKKAGKPNAARAVGSAMAKNPIPLIVPCHRVIRADGRIGEFSAVAGSSLKRLLLGIEGATSFR
jgi:methylated-DNA-[protein]-cysteine S-methyltransferase